jgi:hypothetical protein
LSESERIGTDKKSVQEVRTHLNALRIEKLKELVTLENNPIAKQKATIEYFELEKRIEEIQQNLMQQYSVHVLESLEKEARLLRYLTISLIGLTGVLALLTAVLAFHLRWK